MLVVVVPRVESVSSLSSSYLSSPPLSRSREEQLASGGPGRARKDVSTTCGVKISSDGGGSFGGDGFLTVMVSGCFGFPFEFLKCRDLTCFTNRDGGGFTAVCGFMMMGVYEQLLLRQLRSRIWIHFDVMFLISWSNSDLPKKAQDQVE
mmetsp:Transcript_8343/g.16628  ORF Transcript_8343/g.16628 Transcript_8343/m.16628 type:complete len:149 (+) Transcript_8343:958-1404(+)